MKDNVKFIVFGLVAGLAIGLLAPPAVDRVRQSRAPELPIVWMHPQLGNPWYALHSLGFWDACEDLGVHCVEYSTDAGTVESWLEQCDMMVAAGGAAGLTATVHNDGFDSCLNQLDGAPFANVHGFYNDHPAVIACVTPDPVLYATEAAHEMAAQLDGVGTVIVVQTGFNDFENNVTSAFCKVIEGNYDITCTNPQMIGRDVVEGTAVAAALLQQYPDATGGFGSSSYSPAVLTAAAKERGMEAGDLVIIGMDAIEENLDLIGERWVHAVVAQPGYEENYVSVQLIVAHNNGEPVDMDQILPSPLVKADSIEKYYDVIARVNEYLAK